MPSNTTQHFYGSEQQWLVSLNVNGVDYGVFDKFSGGDVTSSPVKNRPGGMGDEITYTALPVYSDIVITKVYETQKDHARVGLLKTLVGRAVATVTLQPLDDSGIPWGSPTVFNGRLAAVKTGQTDSNSNSPRMVEIDLAVETITQ